MSAATVQLGIGIKFAGCLAKHAQNIKYTGTSLWTIIDAMNDVVAENKVKGQDLTNLDTALAASAIGNMSQLSAVFADIADYCVSQTDGASPGLGLSDGINGYLASRGLRVPYLFAELWYQARTERINPEYVFPKGTWAADIADNAAAGLHDFGQMLKTAGTWAFTANEGALPTTVQGAPIVAVSDAGAASAVTVTVTALTQDRVTTKAIVVTADSFSADAQTILGAQAISSGAAAGQKVVSVAATGQFTAGDWVLLVEGTLGNQDVTCEVAQVDTISTNASLTMESNLVNAFTTSGFVWPLFTNVTAISAASGGSNSDAIDFYARPDRLITVTPS